MAIDPSGWQLLLVSAFPTHFVSEEMQLHLSYYFFSLTRDMNRHSQNPKVPTAKENNKNDPGVRVQIFLRLAICQFSFASSLWLL